MSRKSHRNIVPKWQDQVIIFAALGNKIRLSLIARLFDGQPYSISQLAAGSKLTRQAVKKHLAILESAKIVVSMRVGRESLYKFAPERMEKIREYLDYASRQWGQALLRLKSFVES